MYMGVFSVVFMWRRGSKLCHRPTVGELDPALGQVSPSHESCPSGCSASIQLELCIKRGLKPDNSFIHSVVLTMFNRNHTF